MRTIRLPIGNKSKICIGVRTVDKIIIIVQIRPRKKHALKQTMQVIRLPPGNMSQIIQII